jgi:hypothetical protein
MAAIYNSVVSWGRWREDSRLIVRTVPSKSGMAPVIVGLMAKIRRERRSRRSASADWQTDHRSPGAVVPAYLEVENSTAVLSVRGSAVRGRNVKSADNPTLKRFVTKTFIEIIVECFNWLGITGGWLCECLY